MLVAFLLGIAAGEAFQWGTWKASHLTEPWSGYWKVGLPHLIINVCIVTGVGVAWRWGLLTDLLALVGATPIAQLLSLSPPYGFVLAFTADVCGDKLAYALRQFPGQRIRALLPGGGK